jgi:hypothetical protein
MCTVFWDGKIILHVEFLPPGSTINTGVYCGTLKKLCCAIQNKRRGMLSQDVVMLHDKVKEAVNMWFPSQATSFYDARIQTLVPRYDKCLNNGRNYAEKWCKVCTAHGNINGYFLDNLRN